MEPASLGTPDRSSPFTYEQIQERNDVDALREALDASYKAIKKLEASNKKLSDSIADSNKENRQSKREKSELLDRVEQPLVDLNEQGHEQSTVNEDRPQSRILEAQLDANVREIRRLESTLAKEEDANDKLTRENERLQEKVRLMKRGSGEGESREALFEQKELEVEVLRQRLMERDETLRLAEVRIAEKNSRIAYLKEFFWSKGYRIEDEDETRPLAETLSTAEKTDPEMAREGEGKGNSALNEQLSAENAFLKTRVSQLEQHEQNPRSGEEMSRNSDQNQRALIKEIEGIIVAVTNGDMSQKIAMQPGEMNSDIVGLKHSINTMVDQLQIVSHKITDTARQLGREWSLGLYTRPTVNASGIWKEMIENVSELEQTLTTQIRSIATSVQAIGQGDFSHKIEVEAQGDFLFLKETINNVIDILSRVVTDVIKLGKETAVEGVLGGQANVEHLYGMWKTMVDHTNFMACVLTGQARSVGDIVDRVRHGDTTLVDMNSLGEFQDMNSLGTLHKMHMAINAMLEDLQDNWTRGAAKVGKKGRDDKLQQEKLQRIWTILHSKI